MSICSSGKACTFQLNNDREIIELAERAHAAFPQIAVLGVDIIREQPSGKLYVIEVNSTGGTWHFSSATGESIQRDAEINFESQFGGLRTAAQVLVEKTHQAAA
jgi:glutathione synthase/RimK-type ligase-like ATP-grasp enzyme